jgi:hypothetical protein
LAYLGLLVICYPAPMRWLYWLPTVGTFALVVFGYCLLARFLSLMPWNDREEYTLERLGRTFFSAPNLDRVRGNMDASSCAGGLCTIEAQVAPRADPVRSESGTDYLLGLEWRGSEGVYHALDDD